MKEPRVSYKLDPDEHREAWLFAAYRHVGGSHPINSFMKEAAFAWMAKYPIPEAKRTALEAKYQETFLEARAAQPEAPGEGNDGQPELGIEGESTSERKS